MTTTIRFVRPRIAFSHRRSAYRASKAASCARPYHSYEHDETPPFNDAESSILAAALSHVPSHGFSSTSIIHGARDAGYLDASTNLFPRGPFDLINYHLVTQRLALQDRIQFPDQKLGVGAKVRSLALQRLRANEPIISRWQEGLAVMALPSHIAPSLRELASLSDEIWFLAGDTSVDTSWYTKRATLSAIYSSAEIFMTTDTSANFIETEQFLDRRLEDARIVGAAVGNVGQWVGFTAMGFVNLLRNKGARI